MRTCRVSPSVNCHAFSREAQYRDEDVCLLVYMHVCLSVHKHISGTHSTSCVDAQCDKLSVLDAVCNCTQTGEWAWSSHEQGVVLSSFYCGYALTQLVAGCVSPMPAIARWWLSGRCLLLVGSLVTGVMTLVTPIVTTSGHVVGLAVARAAAGVGQVTPPHALRRGAKSTAMKSY